MMTGKTETVEVMESRISAAREMDKPKKSQPSQFRAKKQEQEKKK